MAPPRRVRAHRVCKSFHRALRALSFASGRPPSLASLGRGPRERARFASAHRRSHRFLRVTQERAKNTRDPCLPFFSSGFLSGAGPWGPSIGGFIASRRRVAFVVPGYGAEPCRLVRAKRRRRQGFGESIPPHWTPVPQEGVKEGR